MTDDQLALESLHAALDLDPSDQDTRRVLADWYDDAQDDVMAAGLRWMAEGDRYPWRIPGNLGLWQWIVKRDLNPRPLESCAIPSSVELSCGPHTCISRRAAEEALCRAMTKA